MSHDDRSTRDATKKYQQIVVPDHALKPDTSGTSFLRTGTFPSLTDATKQPPGFRKSLELARLAGDHHLKTGGSWHHVDGNRIETTTGRKVEVIAGSYIAHRGPGNSPGPNFSATWATNSYTQVGSQDLPVGGLQSTTPAAPSPDYASSLTFPFSASSIIFNPPSNPNNPQAMPPDVDTTAPGNTGIQNGDVATATWAQRVLTYVGSIAQPVPIVYAETHAGSIETRSYAEAGDIFTLNHASGKVNQDTMAAAITTTQEAAAITVVNTAANLLTQNFGAQEVFNEGPLMVTATAAVEVTTLTAAAAVTTLTAAAVVDTLTSAAAINTFNVGKQTTINVPENLQFTLSDGKIVASGDEMTALHNELTGVHKSIKMVWESLSGDSKEIQMVTTRLNQMDTSIGGIKQEIYEIHMTGS